MVGLRIFSCHSEGIAENISESSNHVTGAGRGTFLQEANGDVPLDRVASSRLD